MAKVTSTRSDSQSDDGKSKLKNADKDVMDVDDGSQQDDADEENGEEFEIELILDAKRGSFPNGRIGYFVKWKGYDDSENSWVDENDAGNATSLIEDFWRRNPKKASKTGRKSLDAKATQKPGKPAPSEEIEESASVATKKRGRKSQADIDENSRDRTTKKSKKNGAKPETLSPTPDQVPDIGNMNQYMSIVSWEDLVDSVETVERTPDDKLMVYFTLKTGERVVEDSKICRQRFPDQLIQFYENNLRWKAAQSEEDDS
ncbi:hypothetical protein H0H93_000913 [Arthromyces matolae]|nr:hypothetical protein H0H93_000913 [Arthromyces matolae]